MTEDFYDLLEVSPDASQDDIKQAFREQVRIYHPDLNDDERAQAQFTALKTAYDILGDPVERRAYDRLGHEDYVAKRTKGLPSPDLWQTGSDEDDSAAGDDSTDSSRSATDTSTGSGAGTSAGARSGRSAGTGSATGTSTSGSSGGSATSGSRSSSGVGGARAAGATGSAASGSATGSSGGATAGSPGSTGRRRGGRSRPGRLADNAVVRWWRDQNFAWPLIWASALLYLGGLGHFWLTNRAAVATLGAELRVAGADPAALRSTLTGGRHGVDTALGYVTATEIVAPPLPSRQWYVVLAGLVVLSLAVVVGARYAWRRDTWGPVSIDETIVVALALGTATALLGGPLLAGAVLMPLLYGVVLRRTRQLPGWSPSWLYVVCVLGPAVGLGVSYAGYSSLALDAVAFVVLPLSGAFGLPLRANVRKRFGR